MLIKCKICGKYPPEENKQMGSLGDGTRYATIIDENIYFFIIKDKKIAFCSPRCVNRYTSDPSVAK